MSKKVKIDVHTPFLLNVSGEKQLSFGVGSAEVEQEIADHWYVKHHAHMPKTEAAKQEEDEDKSPPPAEAPKIGGGKLRKKG